jgi:hypothetical protein
MGDSPPDARTPLARRRPRDPRPSAGHGRAGRDRLRRRHRDREMRRPVGRIVPQRLPPSRLACPSGTRRRMLSPPASLTTSVAQRGWSTTNPPGQPVRPGSSRALHALKRNTGSAPATPLRHARSWARGRNTSPTRVRARRGTDSDRTRRRERLPRRRQSAAQPQGASCAADVAVRSSRRCFDNLPAEILTNCPVVRLYSAR